MHRKQAKEKEKEEGNKSKSIKYVHRTHIIHTKIQNSTKSNKPNENISNAGWSQSVKENSNGTNDFGKTKITKYKQTGGRITAENCVKWEAKDVDEDKQNEDYLVYNREKGTEKINIYI